MVAGKITYTATFAEDWAEDATKEVAGEAATGHTPGEAVKENETSASLNAPGSYEEVVYCSVCKAELSRVEKEIPQLTGAVAEVNGVKYGTLQAAIDAAQDGETITLLADVNLAVGVEFNKAIELTLNLNGKTITSEQDAIVVTAGTLIIEGNGNVIAATSQVGSWCAVWANGGDVVINGGTYKTYGEPAGPDLPHQNDSIYAKNGSTITINGGYFEYVEYVWTLNVSDKAPGKIIVYGGKFENFDPANNVSRDNFVASGKHTKCVEGIYSICEGEYAENGYCSVCGAENPAAAFVAQIGQKKYLSFAEAYADAEAGDTIILLADLELSQILTIDKAITLDGNGKTLTSTATRAINIETTGAVEIKDLTIVAGERAINIINMAGVVTLNNVTATAKNNAVMIATSAGAVKLTINNSNLTGLAVVNVAGAGAQVQITNTVITNVDATEAENYGAITIWDTASQAVVTVTGGTITVAGDSKQAYVFPADATIKGVAEVGYIIATVGDAGFEDLQTAIDEAIKSGKTIEMVRDYIALADIINGTGVTIDLNGCTLEADILATIKVNGGTFKTSEYTMVAGENACYISTDAIFTISGANLDTTVHSGTLTLGRPEGWTNAGQLLVIEEGATFIIPANFKLYVQSTVVVKGNVQVDGTVVLYGADATIQAPEGLNVITTGDKVVYTEGKYTVHNHTEETVTGKDATCTDTGLTNGVKCSVCGETLTAQKEIPAKGHTNGTPVKENEVPATLNAPGSYDEVVYCSVCKAELSRVQKEIPQLTGAVAEIDGFKYGSLQEAIDAANGKTVTLIADINLGSDYVIVKAGNVVTLDLNGKTISGVSNGNGEPCMIRVENTAKLTIEDSGENGKITLARGTNGTAFVIDVKGDLVLNSGILEMTGSWSIGFVVDIRPNAWGTSYTAPTSFTMNGGKIISGDGAVRVDSNSGTNERLGVTFTMNGGEIDAVYDAVFIQHRYANDLYVNIAGGILSSDFAPIRIYGSEVISNVYINISGGTFNYTGAAGGTGWVVENFLKASNAVLADAAEFNITGGSFEGDITDLLADDQHVTENDGIYTICSGVHTAVVTDPNCVNGGYTTYTCPTCGDEYVADETDALGHNEVVDKAVDPDCVNTGLTEGKHCDRCNEVLVAQQPVPATGHDFENGSCNVCGAEDPNYVEILTQPTDAEVALGAEAKFTVAVNNKKVTYQWYFSNTNGRTWGKVDMEGSNTSTLTVKALAYRNGHQYKCVITNEAGETVESEIAVFTVKNCDVEITTQPTNVEVGVGSDAKFTVELNKTAGVAYQWYFSNNKGETWSKLDFEGNDSATLTVKALAYRYDHQYKCVITDAYGNVIESNTVSLVKKVDDVAIETQPTNVEVAVGSDAKFTVELNKTAGVAYQWYFSNTNGDTWAKLDLEGYNTATLTVKALAYRNGHRYKCMITDQFGNVIESNVVTLSVKNCDVEITTQPTNVEVGVGSDAKFTVELNKTAGVAYQWYFSNTNGATWSKLDFEGNDSATLTVKALAYRYDHLYKCVITDTYGNVIESNIVSLVKKVDNVAIVTQPTDVEVAVGSDAQFAVELNNTEGVAYQWYFSNTNGETWGKLDFEGNDSATLTVKALAYRYDHLYKCVITDAYGNVIESNIVNLVKLG